jgi:iron complex outermembrane receptor protein
MMTLSPLASGAESGTAGQPAAPAGRGLEEMVVTARKREEEIQSVPVAISAFNGEELRENSVHQVEDLRFIAPALQINPSPWGNAVPAVSIRGQRPVEVIITLDPSVAIYFDDVVWQRPHGTNGSMYDLSSVQVLKGPQGTLFGRNTTGGAVLMYSNKPDFNGVGGSVSATFGNYDTHNFGAVLNLPVSDTIALRFAGQTNRHDGYTKNLYNNSDKDNADDQSYRASLLFRPNDAIESNTVYQYFHEDTSGIGYRLRGVNPAGSFGNPAAGGSPAIIAQMNQTLNFLNSTSGHKVINDQLKGSEMETHHISNTTSWELTDALSIKNVIGWRKIHSLGSFDNDGTGILLTTSPVNGPVPLFNSNNTLDSTQFSEELQLNGVSFDNRLNWVTGAYYFREAGDDVQVSDLFFRRVNDGTGENRSWSVYAQGTYDFQQVEGLSLTAGIRETWDRREVEQHQRSRAQNATTFSCLLTAPPPSGTGAGIPLNPCDRTLKYDDSAPSWGLTLNYAFNEDVMLYLARRHGYKSGGVQLRANDYTEPTTFEPEFVDDWELGLKSTFDIGSVPVRVNAAVYNQDYSDIQRSVSAATVANRIITTTLNAGSATIRGGELEVTAILFDDLELSGFYTYTDASYDEFKQARAGGGFQDLSDSDFSGVPENVAGASITYRLPLSGEVGDVSAKLSWYRQDEIMVSDVNVINGVPNNSGELPSYHRSDASVDWNNVFGAPFDLRFYARNRHRRKVLRRRRLDHHGWLSQRHLWCAAYLRRRNALSLRHRKLKRKRADGELLSAIHRRAVQ